MSDSALSLDTTLKIGEILAIVGGVVSALVTVGRMSMRVEMTLKQQNEILADQSGEMRDLKEETKKIAGVLTTIAVQDTRINRIEDDIRDMKHGKGFVKGNAD